jgi:hypothetical protein
MTNPILPPMSRPLSLRTGRPTWRADIVAGRNRGLVSTVASLFSSALLAVCLAGWALTVTTATVLAGDRAAPPSPRSDKFFPLGVYWPGEFTFQDRNNESERWQLIERALDDLQSHQVNTVWLTHLPAAETARVAELAATRGIALVAACAELAGDVPHIRNSDHAQLIAQTKAAWGDAPLPLAWGLGDEPAVEAMEEMGRYRDAWTQRWPGEPTVVVCTAGQFPAAQRVGFPLVCADVYPFFGRTGGYAAAPHQAWSLLTRRLVSGAEHGDEPSAGWMMGQAFQEPKGPFTADDRDHVVYLADGEPHWVMPTPAQVTWQAWAGVAEGAQGVFFFVYRWPTERTAGPVRQGRPSGSPRGLVSAHGVPTPQYRALGEAYRELSVLGPLLRQLRPDPLGFAGLADSAAPSTRARWLRHAKSQERYLLVVADYDQPADQPTEVWLGPEITRLQRISTDPSRPEPRDTPLISENGLWKCSVILAPGTGCLLKAAEDPAQRPLVFATDFSDENALRQAISQDRLHMVEHSLFGSVLTAVDGQAGWTSAAVFDLDRALAPLTKTGFRVLQYEGAVTGGENRGVQWSSAAQLDGVPPVKTMAKSGTPSASKPAAPPAASVPSSPGREATGPSSTTSLLTSAAFEPFSLNAFDRFVRVPGRFLRLSVSWAGAGDHQYGFLGRWTVWQWKRPVKTPPGSRP